MFAGRAAGGLSPAVDNAKCANFIPRELELVISGAELKVAQVLLHHVGRYLGPL